MEGARDRLKTLPHTEDNITTTIITRPNTHHYLLDIPRQRSNRPPLPPQVTSPGRGQKQGPHHGGVDEGEGAAF